MLAWLFIVRPVQKHVLSPAYLPTPAQAAALAGSQTETPALHASMHAPELGKGTVRAALLKEQTAELIRQKPVNTARAVQAWLREEPS